jgi:hypothetical protein
MTVRLFRAPGLAHAEELTQMCLIVFSQSCLLPRFSLFSPSLPLSSLPLLSLFLSESDFIGY